MDVNGTIGRTKGLTNKHLTSILKSEGLPSSGNKSQLVGRVVTRIQELARQGRQDDFNALKNLIYGTENVEPPRTMFHPFAVPSGPPRPNPKTNSLMRFRDTAFYSIVEPLSSVHDCPIMVNHRHTITAQVVVLQKLSASINDKTGRIMLFCTSDSLEGFSTSEISFPVQVELKVNGQVVKANFRGLKNKPGTTRPADITDQLQNSPGFRNIVTLTYALTQKAFHFQIMYTKYNSVDNLVEKIKNGRVLSIQTVKNQIISKASDPDVVATSTVLSLKCPLSTLRIDLPCRSNLCSHVACFDANSFLQTQEQAPTWTCPICSRIISFEALVVDDYVRDILKRTSRDVDSVVIDPSGEWSTSSKSPGPTTQRTKVEYDDEDIVEILDSTQPASMFGSTPSRPMASNPVRAVTTSSASTPSNKRPIAQVIDLTLSDSEDDNPAPPPKRQSVAPARLPFLTASPNMGSSSTTPTQPQVYPVRIDQQPMSMFDTGSFSPFRTPDPYSPNTYYRNDNQF